MADDLAQQQDRIKSLESARNQLSREWLEVEREKTILAAAIEHLALGFIAVDDYKNIIIKNQAADKILGESKGEQWTIAEMGQKIGTAYDLSGAIDKCFQQKLQIEPAEVSFDGKLLRIFISPAVILKKSITVPMVVILLEELKPATSP